MAASLVTRSGAVVLAVCFAVVNGCGSSSRGDDDDDGGSSGESGSDGTTGGSRSGSGNAGRPSGAGSAAGGTDAGGEPGGGAVSGGTARGGTAGSQMGSGAESGQGEGAASNGAQAGEGATSNGGSSNAGGSNGGSSNGGDLGAAGDSNPPLPVECGDNILVPSEACEDGNLLDDDGCSHDCQVEPGFVCDAVRCDEHGEHCKLVIPVVYRDFNGHAVSGGHPDFAPGIDSSGAFLGAVEPLLDDEGKPVLTSAADATHGYFHGQAAFAQWYRDDAPTNASMPRQLTLWDLGGTLANMWGAHGEYWSGPPVYSNVLYGGPGGTGCEACTPSDGIGACFDPCTPWGVSDSACCADVVTPQYLGDPLFFPIDDAEGLLVEPRAAGSVPPAYGVADWTTEQVAAQALGVSSPIPTATTVFPSSTHNFNFTTEASMWFRFDGSIITFRVAADDDVWLFINGHLAVDLGGYHTPLEGAVSLGYEGDKIYMTQTPADGAIPVTRTVPLSDFGIALGSVYEVKWFHAEREPEGSALSLVVSNGISHVSVCH